MLGDLVAANFFQAQFQNQTMMNTTTTTPLM